eukprot:TRINITY_DN7086_c0_g1_i1.p1 TRINITY_DN7086_c0_g1~~TRINITY_DN7086_c0_g1_i1.p1  ORF type:complete len:780 (+),score=135.84 TRINITY_DN7086_c0_g1_i1:116-2455(+)
MKITLHVYLLFACFIHGIVLQSKGAVSSVSVSGTSSTQVQTQLKNAAKDALDALEADPNDLDNVMKQLANVLLTEIGEIVTALLNGTEINAEIVSVDISDTVGNAMSVAASSGNKFQGLEVDSITQEIRTNVGKILSNLGVEANVSRVSSDVANTVLVAIGNALADITGTNFTFKIRVEATTEAVDQHYNFKYNSTDDVLIVLDKELQKLIKTSLLQLKKNPERLNTEFSTLATQLVNLIGQVLSYLLQEGELQASQQIIPRIIFSLTTVLNEMQFFDDSEVLNIGQQIQSALQISLGKFGKHENMNELTVNLIDTILTPIGEVLSEQLDMQFTLKIDASVDSYYATNSLPTIQDESELNNDVQLQASIQILQSISQTKMAFDLIQKAAQKGQNIAIAAAFLQAIAQGYQKEFDKLLDLFFNEESIPIDTIVFVTTLTTVQGGEPAINIFIKKMQENKDSQQLSRAFSYAFTTFDRSVTDAFLMLIQQSVTDETCGLQDLVDNMFDHIPEFNYQNVLVFLKELDVEKCWSESLHASGSDTYETEISSSENTASEQPSGAYSGESIESPISQLEELIGAKVESILLPISEPTIEEDGDEEDVGCMDTVPPSNFTCGEQKRYGKCTSAWMITGGFCKRTCGTCNQTKLNVSSPSLINETSIINDLIMINETAFVPTSEITPPFTRTFSPRTEYMITPTPEYIHTPVPAPVASESVLELPVRVDFSPVEQHKNSRAQSKEHVLNKQMQCCNKCVGFDVEQLKEIIRNQVLDVLSDTFGDAKK